jgi:hypothetical protein
MIPHFSYKGPDKPQPMTVGQALQLIVKNRTQPAVSYAVGYAEHALCMDPHRDDFKLQLAYVVNNITHWRFNSRCKATMAEIKECRQVLKEASK